MTAGTTKQLPTPDERSEADVVIYDGHCGFCTGIAQWLHRLDGGRRLAFLSLYDPRVGRRYPDLSREDLLKHVYVVDRRGRQWKGAGAVRYLSRRLPAMWPMAPLLHIPGSMPLWRWLYGLVSRHRRQLW